MARSVLFQDIYQAPFQWTTLVVNILGGFMIGTLAYYFTLKEM